MPYSSICIASVDGGASRDGAALFGGSSRGGVMLCGMSVVFKSFPQYRQVIASRLISSAQNGHFTSSDSAKIAVPVAVKAFQDVADMPRSYFTLMTALAPFFTASSLSF